MIGPWIVSAAVEAADEEVAEEIVVWGDLFARWDDTRWMITTEVVLPYAMTLARSVVRRTARDAEGYGDGVTAWWDGEAASGKYVKGSLLLKDSLVETNARVGITVGPFMIDDAAGITVNIGF